MADIPPVAPPPSECGPVSGLPDSLSAKEKRKWLDAAEDARWTCKWAVTMTRCKIKATTRQQGKRERRWNVVSFTGRHGGESVGIVDLVAIRKNHQLPTDGSKRGDRFDIVLIQVKGGSAECPTDDDIKRLRSAARRYKAPVVLCEWKRGKSLTFSRLSRSRTKPWQPLADVGDVFR
jgi:hypothetical protein